jgi:hypothetical protein
MKKNSSFPLHTTLGVITKSTATKVKMNEFGLGIKQSKVIWGEIRSGHKQSRRWSVHKCSITGLTEVSYKQFLINLGDYKSIRQTTIAVMPNTTK